MGNNQPKLHKNFASLPDQDFPTSSKFSKRKRAQSLENLKSVSSPHSKTKDSDFLPEYCTGAYDVLRDFVIETIIAKGAYGNVFKVHKKADNKVLVLKVMQKSKIAELTAQKRVKDEASIQSSLNRHPFIVRAFSFFQDTDNLNILMEFKPNGDLFTLWKQSDRFSENLVRVYVAEIALGLDFLHKNGIIYRDLKMENILLDELGHVSITDFGLSKCLVIGERTRTICGTLQYIAPEVLAMQTYTHAADWWSLGILMYSLLAGHFPVKPGKDHFEMAKMCSQCTYELPFYGNYSNDAKQIVKHLLSKDNRRRLHDIYSLQGQPFFQSLSFDVVFAKKVPVLNILLEHCKQYTTKSMNEILCQLPPTYSRIHYTDLNQNSTNGDYLNGFDYDATFKIDNRTYVWCSSIAQAESILV